MIRVIRTPYYNRGDLFEHRDVLSLSSYDAHDGAETLTVVSQFTFYPDRFGSFDIVKLAATLSVSDGAETASVELYKVSSATTITDSVLSTSSTSPVRLETSLTDDTLADTFDYANEEVYEVHLKVTGGAGKISTAGGVFLLIY